MRAADTRGVILCDFDGTIVAEDVLDSILDEYGSPGWRAVGRAFEEGSLSYKELFELLLKELPPRLDIIKDWVKMNFHARAGFWDFYAWCKGLGYEFVVISSGWDFYISAILCPFGKPA